MNPTSESGAEGGRQRKLTEAGKEHKKDLKMKAFKRQIKELQRYTEEIIGSQEEVNPDAEKEQLKTWTHSYVNLIQIVSDLCTLVAPEELATLEKDTERFHILNKTVQEALQKKSTAPRAPSVAASRTSGASSASVRAALKILRIQDEHQHAALRAKQAAVQQRRQLEKEKQALK